MSGRNFPGPGRVTVLTHGNVERAFFQPPTAGDGFCGGTGPHSTVPVEQQRRLTALAERQIHDPPVAEPVGEGKGRMPVCALTINDGFHKQRHGDPGPVVFIGITVPSGPDPAIVAVVDPRGSGIFKGSLPINPPQLTPPRGIDHLLSAQGEYGAVQTVEIVLGLLFGPGTGEQTLGPGRRGLEVPHRRIGVLLEQLPIIGAGLFSVDGKACRQFGVRAAIEHGLRPCILPVADDPRCPVTIAGDAPEVIAAGNGIVDTSRHLFAVQ